MVTFRDDWNFRTNLPKEVMAFPDFAFPSTLPSFIGHEDVKRYLEAYAERFGLLKHMKVCKEEHIKRSLSTCSSAEA